MNEEALAQWRAVASKTNKLFLFTSLTALTSLTARRAKNLIFILAHKLYQVMSGGYRRHNKQLQKGEHF